MRTAIVLAIACVAAAPATAGEPVADCTLKGFRLWGDVQIVESFPDLKVQVVKSFPDLKVQRVASFPDSCGKWKYATAFPNLKIQFVDSFPDLKIEYVESFPGLP